MTTISREQLFDLLWTQPRTVLVARFGISDVALGKLCKRARIPMPIRGYWTLAAGGNARKRPALPMRWPGESHLLHFGAQDTASSAAEDVIESTRPEFREDIELQVRQAMHTYSSAASREKLSTPHSALRQVLAAEDRRRARSLEDQWAEPPRFDSLSCQAQIELLNALAHALGSVGFACKVSSRASWKQGTGTTHSLCLQAFIGAVASDFSLVASAPPTPRNRTKGTADAAHIEALVLEPLLQGEQARTWTASPGRSLRSQLREITKETLRTAETRLRIWSHHQDDHSAGQNEMAGEKRENERLQRLREAPVLQEAAALRRQDVLNNEAMCWHQAEQLRAYVAAVAAKHPESTAWQAWALSLADEMDPLNAKASTFRQH